MDNKKESLITSLVIFVGVVITFATTYSITNWYNSTRGFHYHLYTNWELLIPLVEWTILFYYSAYIAPVFTFWLLNDDEIKAVAKAFIAAAIIGCFFFLLIPTQLGFARDPSELSSFKSLYFYIWNNDRPHNMAPSLHVVMGYLSLMPIINKEIPQWAKNLAIFFVVGISISIITVHQHHLIDLVTGIALAHFCYSKIYLSELLTSSSAVKSKSVSITNYKNR